MSSRELMVKNVRYGGEFFEGQDIFVGIDVNNSKWALTRRDGTMMSKYESSKKQRKMGRKRQGASKDARCPNRALVAAQRGGSFRSYGVNGGNQRSA